MCFMPLVRTDSRATTQASRLTSFLRRNDENAESIEPVRGIGGVVRRDLPVESNEELGEED